MHIIDTLLQFSWRGVAHRVAYEAANRSGLRSVLEPSGDAAARRALEREHLRPAEDWMRERPAFLLRAASEAGRPPGRDEQLIERASRAVEGTLWAFGATPTSYGTPVRWHIDPVTDHAWVDSHWSRCRLRPGPADVKRVWEIGRFPQTYLFLRAYARDHDTRWPDAFFAQVDGWIAANPYRRGVHWANGQEIAIRVIAWLCGLYGFADLVTRYEDVFRRMQGSIALQCDHVSRHIDYARYGMRNNHLLGESLALYVAGATLPWLRQAARWRKDGVMLLEEGARTQFSTSGEYVQNSHTYHRLATVYLALAVLTARAAGEALPSRIEESLAASADLLDTHMSRSDGRLPNWGENDGADVFPIAGADYTDFRPALALARLALGVPMDTETNDAAVEVATWVRAPGQARSPGVRSASAAEPPRSLHVLRRSAGTFVSLRTAPWTSSLGHADLNHADVWLDGVNVACDTGSYLYNVDREVHQWLSSTPAHNTVSLDGGSQRRRLRSWRWSGQTAGMCIAAPDRLEAECRSYEYDARGPLVHRRVVEAVEGGFVILDEARAGSTAPLVLQWLLVPGEWQMKRDGSTARFALSATSAGRRLRVTVEITSVSPDAVVASLVMGRDGEGHGHGAHRRRGWFSRYYGVLTPAASASFEVVGTSLAARTQFTLLD